MVLYENKNFIFDRPLPITLKEILKQVLYRMKAVYYKALLNINKPNIVKDKKYNVSVCAIFRNEAPYLKEWIEFHRIIGVEHFYLYNNFSDDNYKEVLNPYINEGVVELTEWPVKQGQMKAYEDCYNKHKDDTKWIGYIDLDEFVVPVLMNNIYDFLKKFEKNRPAILIYWRLFGTSGMVERDRTGLVTEDFTSCWMKYDTVGKCFFNTNYTYNDKKIENMHNIWGECRGMKLPPVNFCDNVCFGNYNPVIGTNFPIQINHYFTKSYKEYIDKVSRGDAFFEINPRDEQYFYRHEMLCKSKEYKIYKYLIALKLQMNN